MGEQEERACRARGMSYSVFQRLPDDHEDKQRVLRIAAEYADVFEPSDDVWKRLGVAPSDGKRFAELIAIREDGYRFALRPEYLVSVFKERDALRAEVERLQKENTRLALGQPAVEANMKLLAKVDAAEANLSAVRALLFSWGGDVARPDGVTITCGELRAALGDTDEGAHHDPATWTRRHR